MQVLIVRSANLQCCEEVTLNAIDLVSAREELTAKGIEPGYFSYTVDLRTFEQIPDDEPNPNKYGVLYYKIL